MRLNKLLNYMAGMILIPLYLVLAGCSQEGLRDSLGGFSSQSPMEQTMFVTQTSVDALALKKAFVQVNEDWSKAKKDFDFGKIPDETDRNNVKTATEAVDKTLSNIQSVRKGDVVETAIVAKDLAMFREQLRPAVKVLKENLALHGSVTTPERRTLYARIVANLELITSDRWDNIKVDQRLLKYLEAISNVATLVDEFKE